MSKLVGNEIAQYFESIFTVSCEGIVIVDHDGVILRVNPTFTNIFGYKEAEILGKPFDILAYKSQTLQKITSHNSLHRFYCSENTNMEVILFDKAGRAIPVRFRSSLIRDEHTHVKQAIGMIEHIIELSETDERNSRLTEKMWEAQQNFENVLDNSVDAIILCDISGNIMMANKAFSQMLDYEQKDVKGKHIVEFTGHREGTYTTTIGEEVIIDEKCVTDTASKSAELFENGCVSNWEYYLVKKNNVHVPVEITMSVLKDKEGDRRGSVVIARDIGERRKGEKKIIETRDFLENIFKTTADGIIVSSPEGYITMVNEAVEQMLGYSKDELIGKHPTELGIKGSEHDKIREEFITKLFEEGHVVGFEHTWVRKDGSFVDIEMNITFLKDPQENITGAVASVRDITERKRHQEELKKAYEKMEMRVKERTAELEQAKEVAEVANKAKSEFLANMSHELRTPMNHIIGFTELVVDKKFGDLNGSQEEYLGDVLDSSKHLLSLINDILDLSKVEAGKLKLELSDFNLESLLESSLVMFKEKSFKHGIDLSIVTDQIPETITADERKLKQVLYNLLSNAMKFTPDGGKVLLIARKVDCVVRPGLRCGDPEDLRIIEDQIDLGDDPDVEFRECVEFSVSDTGIGIKPEHQKTIFDPFEQVDGTSSRKYQGTGLGLSLTKNLVELHGGKIWVESKGEGNGSTFNFIISL